MTVVDSSVWIANLRGLETVAVGHLRRIIHNRFDQIVVGDLVLLEVLQGARDDGHAVRIEQNMRRFTIASMLNPSLATMAACNYRALRNIGITVRKTADMIIGTFCLVEGYTLLHDDRDFLPMVQHLGLRVV